ncbi:hypothetical protein ACFLRF_04275 [Candidatus Altiarchaeota archaeon]
MLDKIKKKSLKRILSFYLILSLIHVGLGLYAVSVGGLFWFGTTSIERYAVHLLTSSEARFSLTGSPLDIIDDLCIQKCSDCRFNCYPLESLKLECGKDCMLKTVSGTLLLTDGDKITYLLKKGVLAEDVKFTCKDAGGRDCGFESYIGRNMTFTSNLPEELTS